MWLKDLGTVSVEHRRAEELTSGFGAEILTFIFPVSNIKVYTHFKSDKGIKARWYIPEIPALLRLKQVDPEFQASLCYTVRPSQRPKTGLEIAQC